jgi:hypothetical protein
MMRRTYGHKAEEALRRLGLVHRGAGLYVSEDALRSRIDRRLSTCCFLENVTATNDLGQSFTLSELSGRNTSNPVVRRAELMVRVRGVETYAIAQGHVGLFFVVTLPSRFHCMREDGTKNPRYGGASVRDGQEWMNRQWQRLRAALNRNGILFYGLRTAEPHHDGTVHWNMLMFVSPADAKALATEFEKYFLLADSPDEPGARAHRVRCKPIDRALGDATSYIAKYISKGIDGFGVGIDEEDRDRRREAVETCVRAEAWASLHGIRQFQFFGGPTVSVWREVRRLQRPSMGLIEAVRQAADEPNWTAYIRVQGGVRPTNSSTAITSTIAATTTRWPVCVYKADSDEPGLYGDPVRGRIVGVESDDLVEVTRVREWVINWPGTRRSPGFFSSSESCQ